MKKLHTKRVLIAAAITAAFCFMPLSLQSVWAAEDYGTQLGELLSTYPEEEKVLEVNTEEETVIVNGEETTFSEELGISSEEEQEAFASEEEVTELLEEYGYEQTDTASDGTLIYENRFISMRLIVPAGEAGDTYGAIETVNKYGEYLILQYATQEETALAYQSFIEQGCDVIVDEALPITSFYLPGYGECIGYGSDLMGLSLMQKSKVYQQKQVIVAVIDSGVNKSVLGDRVINGVDTTSEGIGAFEDLTGHGTKVASVILDATPDNVYVMPIRVFDSSGNATVLSVDQAITAAYEQADVINMSLGAESADACTKDFWNSSIDQAVNMGIPVIAAAGNYVSGKVESTDNVYPACYEPCWTVAAVTENKEQAYFSVTGNIDFSAPGSNISVVQVSGSVGTDEGTSFSAPYITALAAMLKASGQYGSAEAMYEEIVSMCEDLGEEGYDNSYGYGIPRYECTEHVPEVHAGLAATCTEAGYTDEIVCSVCGEVLQASESIPATGHTVVKDAAVAATYTSTGLTEGSHCSVCGKIITAQKTIARKLLSTPKLLSASNAAKGVTVTWKAVSNVQKYRVFRKVKGGSWTTIATVAGTVTSYTDTKAKSGTAYIYTVRCIASNGAYFMSGYDSNGVSVLYLAQPAPKIANGATGLTVSWSKIAGATGYYVYRKTSTTSWKKIATRTSSQLTYTDTSVSSKNGSTYYYTVRAYKSSTLSSFANNVKYLRLTRPAISSQKNTASRKLVIAWKKNGSASGYQVQYSTSSKFTSAKTVKITKNSTLSKTLSSLTKGKTYYVRIRSYRTYAGATYYSAWSSTKSTKITK